MYGAFLFDPGNPDDSLLESFNKPLDCWVLPMCEFSISFLRLCSGGTLTIASFSSTQGVHGVDVSGPERFQPASALECV
jgi:hypothetical protein